MMNHFKVGREFLKEAEHRFLDPTIHLCNEGQNLVDQLAAVIQRGLPLERSRALSLLVSLLSTIEELRRTVGYLSQIGITDIAKTAQDCADFLDKQLDDGLQLTGISMDEVEELRRSLSLSPFGRIV